MIRAALIVASLAVPAHDSWINKGGYRNSSGAWCCGEQDCEKVPKMSWESGWIVDGVKHRFDEFIPSQDGEVWVCRDVARFPRCLFGPPPGS